MTQLASNARFLGNVISEPLYTFRLKDQERFDYQSKVPLSDMMEDQDQDPEELSDEDWAAQKTEYEL